MSLIISNDSVVQRQILLLPLFRRKIKKSYNERNNSEKEVIPCPVGSDVYFKTDEPILSIADLQMT